MGKTRKNWGLVIGGGGLVALLFAGCALKESPTTGAVVEEALPATTEVPGKWSAEALDTGKVDDGWIKDFKDSRLETLVEEAMENNPNDLYESIVLSMYFCKKAPAFSPFRPIPDEAEQGLKTTAIILQSINTAIENPKCYL